MPDQGHRGRHSAHSPTKKPDLDEEKGVGGLQGNKSGYGGSPADKASDNADARR